MELKYKVGDDVLLKGTVVSVDPSDGNLPYRVEFGSGAMWVNAKDITQKVAEAQRRPQVGDWVICNDDVFHDAVGQIAKDDHSSLPFKVVFADGRHQWFYESEVKLTDKPTEDQESSTKFKVGDWVKSIVGSCEDLVGQIIENDGSFIPYLVKFTGVDEPHWKLESSVVAAEEPKPPLKFKVGEHVIHKFAPHWGVGKITAISEGNTDIDLTQHYEGSMDDKANRPVAENTCQYRVVYPEVTGRGLDRRWWTSEANLIRVEVK